MTYRCYRPKDFSDRALTLIGYVNEIIDHHAGLGLDMTLRQIHYQLVNRPDYENTDANYDKLGKLLSDARLAGLVSWTAIIDLERQVRGHLYHDLPEQVFRGLDESYRLDKWKAQPFYPIVGVEKRALEGVISGICYKLEVPFIAFKGYSSQSTTWRLGQRLGRAIKRGQRPIVFHLGDHDPSGIDMTRDTQERLSLFAGAPIMVQRLALNMPQVEQYKPHPNPLKLKDGKHSDSRARDYIAKFGYSSWELDALDPTVIQDMISDAVMKIRDEEKWAASMAEQVDGKRYIADLIEQLGITYGDEEDDD